MQAMAVSSTFDPSKFPEPLDENDHLITVQKCVLKRQRLIPEGEQTVLNLKQAVQLLAPSKTRTARANVMKLKPGYFIGVKAGDKSNFVIVNPTSDGDIRWLLRKHPDLPVLVQDIYWVESVNIRRNAIDLPMDDLRGDPR
jgi:hypothetical protein